jgi:N,N'-diacetylbacillosaminyl-diphospho-undecaprenol alpha-1,3-N-acetylgalactosaminyltransferase
MARLVRAIVTQLYWVGSLASHVVWFTNANDLAYFRDHGLVAAKKTFLTRNYLDTGFYSASQVSGEQIADARKELGVGPDDLVVMMAARTIWPKGVREFAEAAEALSPRFPNAQFLLVGPAEEGNRAAVPEAYLREKERSANFRWLGFRRDMRTLYAVADIAALPSYYKEGGFPRALTEPMAMGKPIVTTESGDCRGTVEEGRNGYCVPVRDSRALAEALARLLDDAELRARLGAYSRVKAERDFDEQKIIGEALAQLGLLAPSP